MAEVKLEAIRIGFSWSAELQFPSGFLTPEESVRLTWRRFADSAESFPCDSERVSDSIILTLDKAVTAGMSPGTYIGEAVIFVLADPSADETVMTDNLFLVECDHSPSEA